jgi:hypothetical protein
MMMMIMVMEMVIMEYEYKWATIWEEWGGGKGGYWGVKRMLFEKRTGGKGL